MTDKQREFINQLRAKNGITTPMLNWFIRDMFKDPDVHDEDDLTVPDASTLIDVMKTWDGPPPAMRRAFGQLELPGVKHG